MKSTAVRYAALGITLAVALLGNVLLPWVFWDYHDSKLEELLAVMAAGALVAEVCLLAIWGALGSQPIVVRLPVTLALMVIGACSYVVGLQLPDLGRRTGSDMPLEVAVMVGIAALLMFLAVQVPLCIARAVGGRYIDDPEEASRRGRIESARFGVAYLMACTACVAILIVAVQSALPTRAEGIPTAQLLTISIGMISFAALSALICIPCARLTLRANLSQGALAWLVTVFLFGPPLVLLVIHFVVERIREWGEPLAMVYSFCLGLSGTMLASLLGVRWLGLRLIDGKNVAGENTPPPTSSVQGDDPQRRRDLRRRRVVLFLMVGACALGLLAASWPLFDRRDEARLLRDLRLRGVRVDRHYVQVGARGRKPVDSVTVGDPGFSDWDRLRELDCIHWLSLEDSGARDFGFLASFIELEFLCLDDTAIADLTPVSRLRRLRQLQLGGTAVTDVSPLVRLDSLEQLGLRETGCEDLTPIAGLDSLAHLDLAGSSVVDLRPLAKLSSLRHLDLSNTEVTDLTPLHGLSLEHLVLRGTRIQQPRIDSLEAAVPGCVIDR